MKTLKPFLAGASFVLVGALVITASSLLANHYLSAQDVANKAKFVTCKQTGVAHTVTLQDNKANPQHTFGKLCDTMTITNKDSQPRLIAFGPHEDHQPYDGVTERILGQGQSLTITFNEIGNYHFHDHIADVIQGDFTVAK
jgi:plastocyanin